jgi:hypothetical protein
MDDNKRFLLLLKPVLRQLVIEFIMKEVQLFFCMAAAWTVLFLSAARFIVIPFLNRYLFIGFAILLMIHLIRIIILRPGWRNAADVYNAFVPDDRVITGFGFLHNGGSVEKLQLHDAVQHMMKRQNDVLKRKKKLILPKWLALGILLSSFSIGLYLIPNEKIKLAKVKEENSKIVKTIEKQLDKKAKEEKDPAVKKALKEAEKKISKADSTDDVLKELRKQTKNLELKALKEKEKQESLKKWQATLQDAGLNHLANLLAKKDLKEIEKELKRLNQKFESLTEKQKEAFRDITKRENQLSEEELRAVMKAIEEALESPEKLKNLADAQDTLQTIGSSLEQQMIANGTPPSKLAFSSSNGSQNNAGSAAQPSSSGNRSQSGQGKQSSGGNQSGSGNGKGNRNGGGSGSGSGNGNGLGNGTASSNGSGNGRGAGLGQGSRQLLTIPEFIDGKNHVETDTGKLGKGNAVEQSEGNGPILKGTLRPYSEVFGKYEESFRQSTERYKLPSDLEEMVKNYFSSIDPDRE